MKEPRASNVPKIRFKGFSGEWVEKKLGDVSESYSGGTPSVGNRSYYGGAIPFVRSAEINATFTELTITELGLRNSSAKMVSKGQVLYALYGATSGEVGISQIDGAINQAILAIEPYDGYSSEFIAIWLRNKKTFIVGTYLQGGQGNLSGNIVKSLEVEFPSSKEQQKIGGYFREVDRLIGLHQRKHDKLVTLKKAMLHAMFPQPGTTTPEIRFKGFSGEWVEKKLGDMCTICTGKKDADDGAIDGLYPFFTCAENHIYSHSFSFDAEAILIAGNANVGQTKYYKGKFEAYQRTYVLTNFLGINVSYLYTILNAKLQESLQMQVQVSAMSYIKLPMLKEFGLAVPPTIAEQQKIGSYFRTLDELISQHAIQLQKLKQLKSACLEKMFV